MSRSRSMGTDEKYWAEYDGLQHAKHQLLTRYLGGWFPILSSYRQVIYIDCHAGRGRHKTGQEGSPILALQTLLEHTHRARMLASTRMNFVFFEIDEANYEYLCEEIKALGNLPNNVDVQPVHADYETKLRKIIHSLKQQGQRISPTFAFLDPYGFTLSMDLLNELLELPKCELLLNFMYRYVDMAMHHPAQSSNLDSLFGCSHWRQIDKSKDHKKRREETLDLFSSQLKADFVTHMHMKASNGSLKYVLFHATNDRRGREVIKEAIWAVTPDGSFTAFEHHSPNQLVLIVPDPDLKPLENLLWEHFTGKQVRMEEIYEWLLEQLYRKTHLHQVLREYRNRKIIECSGYTGRFAFRKNPVIRFPPDRPSEFIPMQMF